tara:strand:+ start:734 stop:898 length:165 start_codon:yes stop_codon:yes gene_type:complete
MLIELRIKAEFGSRVAFMKYGTRSATKSVYSCATVVEVVIVISYRLTIYYLKRD